MKRIEELWLPVDVRKLAQEIPLEVIVYEKDIHELLDQIFKTYGKENFKDAVKEILE